jgi:HD-GYP domain-containing protein (c-di-GMP phosphodiesterase class II)
MFVVLPGTWISHSFFTSRFLIRSSTQLNKIIESGFVDVEVDPDRSIVSVVGLSEEPSEASAEVDEEVEEEVEADVKTDVEAKTETETEPKNETKVGVEPETVHSFQKADDSIVQIGQSNLPSEEKAALIYEQSVGIVKDLFEKPTAIFIADAKKVVGRIVDVILSDRGTEESLLRVSEHNYYTYTHSVNVGVYGITLAKHLYDDLQAHNIKELAAGFFLHDLGKIEIDPAIINKPSKLTADEIQTIHKHPYGSYVILKKTQQLSDECRIVALQHHERIDGKGYPLGLKGEEIHEYARICAIADVFDALTSKRSYREPVSAFEALRIMSEEMHGHFDKHMLRKFILLFSEADKRYRAA